MGFCRRPFVLMCFYCCFGSCGVFFSFFLFSFFFFSFFRFSVVAAAFCFFFWGGGLLWLFVFPQCWNVDLLLRSVCGG